MVVSRSILDGYFNPVVFWYQWEYLLTSKEFIFCAGYLRLAMAFHIFQFSEVLIPFLLPRDLALMIPWDGLWLVVTLQCRCLGHPKLISPEIDREAPNLEFMT